MRRRETAKRLLEIDWNFPVYAPDLDKQVEAGRTTTDSVDEALPRSRAFAEIVDEEDDRPLLVLRECNSCKGSDAALLSRKLDNERTVLMTRWFRCVKLPTDVLDKDHPFRNLFAQEHPPHLFLCDKHGKNVIPLDGMQSQTILWKQMGKMLKQRYRKNSARALKEIRKLLNLYDMLDIRKDDYLARLDDVLIKYGPKSPKVKSLKKKLAKLEKDRKSAEKREKELFDIGLIPTEPLSEPVVAK